MRISYLSSEIEARFSKFVSKIQKKKKDRSLVPLKEKQICMTETWAKSRL